MLIEYKNIYHFNNQIMKKGIRFIIQKNGINSIDLGLAIKIDDQIKCIPINFLLC